jgi:hypothetical protein
MTTTARTTPATDAVRSTGAAGAGRSGIALAATAVRELCEALELPALPEARPGAELLARARAGLPAPPPVLLPAADGWVHPGPPTRWDDFTAMAVALGAAPPRAGRSLPDLRSLPAEVVDAEAGVWRLPAVAVRRSRARPDVLPGPRLRLSGARDVRGAVVVVFGTAWAVPLAGLALAHRGCRVVRVEDPRREDPFVLRDALARGQERTALDLDDPRGRDALVDLLGAADVLVDGYTPRVLANVGLDDAALREVNTRLSVVRVGAFAGGDRPGYGPAAECRGGWAARSCPPRLARTSVADPVAGLAAALHAVDLAGEWAGRARVSLEGAVGTLFAVEAQDG